MSGTRWNASLPDAFMALRRASLPLYFQSMEENSPLYRAVGRKAPSPGAHIFLGQPNIFFLTVNAKDRVPWGL